MLLVGAGFLELLAVNEDAKARNQVREAYREEQSSIVRDAYLESSSSHHDAAVNNERTAIAFTAIGVGALATGITWLVVRERSRAATATVQPSFGGARLGGTF